MTPKEHAAQIEVEILKLKKRIKSLRAEIVKLETSQISMRVTSLRQSELSIAYDVLRDKKTIAESAKRLNISTTCARAKLHKFCRRKNELIYLDIRGRQAYANGGMSREPYLNWLIDNSNVFLCDNSK